LFYISYHHVLKKEEKPEKKKKAPCIVNPRRAYTLREFQAEKSIPCSPNIRETPPNYAGRVIR